MYKCVLRLLKLHMLNITSREESIAGIYKGSSLEIGAMHFPLPVGLDV